VERLRRMIKPLEQRYGLERWDDSRIQAGGLWRQEIEQALASASVALLLVSADFLASDFVASRELPPLFRAAKEKGLRILWVPLRPSLWKHIPEIEQYQAVIPPGRTLAEMAEVEQERAFVQIAELILSTFQEQEVRLARLREEEPKRVAADQKEQEVRLAREQQAEEERLAREKKVEAERLEREQEEEAERVAREREAREREARELQAEQERLSREQREEQLRQARDQAEHQNRAELERWKAEAERLDREMKALERRTAPEQAAEKLPQPAKNDRKERLQRYEQEFRRAMNAQFPLDIYVIDGLKRFQQQLELSDQDVAHIKESLLAMKRAEYEIKQPEQQLSRRQEAAKTVSGQSEFRASEEKEQQQRREAKGVAEKPQPSRVRTPFGSLPRSTSGPLFKPFSRTLSRRQLLISAGTGLGVLLGVIAVKKQPKPAKAIAYSTTTWLVRQGDRWEKKTKPIEVQTYKEELPQGVELTMVEISAGNFLMGSPSGEEGRNDYSWISDDLKRGIGVEGIDVEAQRRVTVPAFQIGRFPITQAQWKQVAGLEKVERALNADPSNFKGPDRPVESVSWHDAIEFCRRLSKHTRRNYTLPSEAQWEYACRAGSTTPFYFGETLTIELANYDGNYIYGQGPKGIFREQTTDVGSFPANAWGVQDMHGNVWEWCLDRWHPSLAKGPTDGSAWQKPVPELAKEHQDRRLLRGGSWLDLPRGCRSAYRYLSWPDYALDVVGFRVVCLPQGPSLNP
jgi:formylglycine-generating enzyme required for sulfatase activity